MEGDSSTSPVCMQCIYFNPLPPHGGRPVGRTDTGVTGIISIHSLRMEGDSRRFRLCRNPQIISIHSLRMEGDNHDT